MNCDACRDVETCGPEQLCPYTGDGRLVLSKLKPHSPAHLVNPEDETLTLCGLPTASLEAPMTGSLHPTCRNCLRQLTGIFGARRDLTGK